MKRLLVILAVINIVLLNSVFSQDTTAVDSLRAPSIEFVDKTHDFGKVSSDTTIYYTFIFTNTGTDSLHIKGVRPG